MTAVKGVEAARPPLVSPAVVVVCVAAILWAVALQEGGAAARYPAVPVALATFLAIQLLVPRARWNRDRGLGPGNVAGLLFALQLVVISTLLVTSVPFPGTLGSIPADQYVNTALMLQALGYVCYAVGYVAWTKPVSPKPLLLEPGLTRVIGTSFIVIGTVGLALQFQSVSALVAYFSGQGDMSDPSPATLSSAAAQFFRPFLAYGVIILWAARIARRRPGGRMRPLEVGLVVLALAASATYHYNRAAVVIPLLALVTAYSLFGRRQSPTRIMAFLAILAVIGFLFGQYRNFYSGTEGGAINPANAGLDRPEATFTDNLQVYGNGPQFWATIVQEVDRSGTRHGDTLLGSALFTVPVLGKPFRDGSGPTVYNELIYGEPDISDQILGLGPELYWNFGLPGIVVGYFLLGFAVRRFDDRVEAAPDPLAAFSWSYCGTWVALLVINSIAVLSQIVIYFFWPVFIMLFFAYLARSQLLAGSRPPEVRL
ncbi:O-antigen polymerase [Mycolicibacterium litorale]|uniref:O-antigen polymerase n=1 Tax=Mycolicibacterium litorale TaxID=758802 RepID=UPI003CE8DC1C